MDMGEVDHEDMPSDDEMASDHEATPSDHMDMGDDGDHETQASDDHDGEASGGHSEGSDDGHGDDSADQGEKPRTAVLGGFFAVNGLVLAAAALTRRRDRSRAAAKAIATPTTRKDASR
jgi:hypothetical protein